MKRGPFFEHLHEDFHALVYCFDNPEPPEQVHASLILLDPLATEDQEPGEVSWLPKISDIYSDRPEWERFSIAK